VHSPIEAQRPRTSAGVTLAVIAILVATGAPAAAPPQGGQPTRAEVADAVTKLNADPNLGAARNTRKLVRNSHAEAAEPANPHSPSWLLWIGEAFAWLARTARVLLWMVAILLVGILGLYIKRFAQSPGERSVPLRFSMPTHVRDLDIRPESLPNDIAGTALELWQREEHRAALALLYRGLLSRLAHVHGVPILDSSTEGDCLTLAAAHLPATRSVYAGRLIRVWQRAVYGNIEPSTEECRALCADFAAAVDAPTGTPAVEQAA
jgi:Domain of unknown function (DUF4129)